MASIQIELKRGRKMWTPETPEKKNDPVPEGSKYKVRNRNITTITAQFPATHINSTPAEPPPNRFLDRRPGAQAMYSHGGG